MIGFRVTWLIPVAFGLIGFGSNVPHAMAQTKYPFEATYNLVSEVEQITPDVSKVTISGENADAPYGLTNFKSIDYARFDPTTGAIASVPDAATFGLKGLPIGTTVFSGSGNDSLKGNSSGTAINEIQNLDVTGTGIDSQNLVRTATGTFNITGGSGKFSGATGTFSFVENDILNLDQTVTFKSQAVVSGSFQTPITVAEPGNTAALIGMGIIGVGFGLCRRKLGVVG